MSHYISRAVALGLLEVSHDEALRVPRILPVQLVEDGEAFYKQAAEVLYRLWGEEAETRTEEQCLEIHRLALRGKVDNIAVEAAIALTFKWHNISRFREAVEICRGTLEICENYRILLNLAMSERELGIVEQAFEHSQKVLALCPPEDKICKAATLQEMGRLKANRGEINEAIALYEQSLAINEQIGNVQGKAATLHQLGILKANRGEINEAIALFEQSLDLKEQIGYVQGQAMTLWWLGSIAAQQRNYNKALDYLQPALQILQRIQSPDAEAVRQMVARVQGLIRNS